MGSAKRRTARTRQILFLLAFLAGSTANAEEVSLWRKVGDWLLIVDRTLGDACFAAKVYKDGSILRIGYTVPSVNGPMYFAVGSPHWQSIIPGTEYDIQVRLDNGLQLQLRSTGQDVSGSKFLLSTLDEILFAEIMLKKRVDTLYQGKVIASLSLNGSKRALGLLSECQSANQPGDATDPFAAARPDPFSLPATTATR